jgi:hypothetical protein
MYIIPFGEVKEDRFQISKEYSLIEMIAGILGISSMKKQKPTELQVF